MAAIPKPERSQTVEAIYSWWEGKLRYVSNCVGASGVGEECERRIWYGFRWSFIGDNPNGRMRRLFDRGHREEAVFCDELRGIGCDVRDIDPSTGKQFKFKTCGGHFVAKIDGVAKGVPEAPKTWHNLSFKTAGAKGFSGLQKKGVQEGQPKNWAQAQIEMRLSALERTLFLSVNKDTDELYSERIRYDADEAERLEAKAERIIFAPEPLPGISDDPAFYKCKFCPASQLCHGTAAPRANCRTCLHATPERDGDGRWSCAKWGADIPLDAQREGCPEHRYIPALLKRWGEAVDASEGEGWVEYRAADGLVFRNGEWGDNSYTSKEIQNASPELIRNPEFQEIRARYQGQITERKAA